MKNRNKYRFVVEYANYRKRAVANDDTLTKEVKELTIRRIDRVVMYINDGWLTVKDGMIELSNAGEEYI